jgi:hypothetical protein
LLAERRRRPARLDDVKDSDDTEVDQNEHLAAATLRSIATGIGHEKGRFETQREASWYEPEKILSD